MSKKQTFDWESARLRIAAASTALEELSEYNQEVIRQIWARRAEQLAKVVEEEDQGTQIELVIVYLGCELYAVEAQYIFDIRPLDRITQVPRTPDWIAGVINQRGHILSVINLQRFFRLPQTECKQEDTSTLNSNDTSNIESSASTNSLTQRHLIQATQASQELKKQRVDPEAPYLIVVEVSEMQLALLTGAVLTVQDVPVNQIQESTGMVLNIDPEYVHGVTEHERKDGFGKRGGEGGTEKTMVIVLDLPALLADKRLLIHEEIV